MPRPTAFNVLFRRTRPLGLRHSSTRPNPFPFPGHTHPTAQQIFHLPTSASQSDIKRRYYELVRIYHPDSPACRNLAPDVAQKRFHAISAAYDMLRGKTATMTEAAQTKNDLRNFDAAVWRARQYKKADLPGGVMDERWKDRSIIGALVVAVVGLVLSTVSVRQRALSESLERAREYHEGARFQTHQQPRTDVDRLVVPEALIERSS